MLSNDNIVIKLKADTSDFTTKLATVSAQATQFGKTINSNATAGEKARNMLGNLAIGAGAVATAIGVYAVKSFTDFDAAMSGVRANVTSNEKELHLLEDAAISAGARTIYNASESANAITELGKAGVSTKDILAGGLDGALDLAAAGEMGVADAAELTASTLNQFGLEGKQATHVADLLAAGANAAQGGVQDMGEALKNVGVNAHNLNIGVEETVGALTLFASKGLVGSDAGTKFNSMLQNLVAPSKAAKKEMDNLGLTMYDEQGHFIGLTAFAGLLHDKLGKLSEEERNAAMGKIFSNAALTTANILYEEGAKGVERYTKTVNQNGFAQKQAATLTGNLKGDVEQLSGAFESSMIIIGRGANGPLRSIVQGLTNAMNVFGALPPQVQQLTVLSVAATGGLVGFDRIMKNLTSTGGKFSNAINSFFNPMERFRAAAPSLKSGIGDIANAALSTATGFNRLGGAANTGSTAVSGLKKIGSGALALLGGPWGVAFTAGAAVLGVFAQHAADAKNRTDGYTQALNSGATAAQHLAEGLKTNKDMDWGWWQKFSSGANNVAEALDKAGISQETFIRAAEGDTKAIEDFNHAIQKAKASGGEAAAVTDQLQAKLNQQQKAIEEAKKATEAAEKAQEAETKKKVDNTLASIDNTDAKKKGSAASKDVAGANDILKEKLGATNDAIDDQAKGFAAAVKAMRTYYGFALSADEADDRLEKSIREVGEAARKGGRHFHSATKAGEDERDALRSLAEQALKTAEAHAKNGDSVDKVLPQMEQARAAFVRSAQAMGLSKQEAEALADKYGLTRAALENLIASAKKDVKTKVAVDDKASDSLSSIGMKVKSLKDKTFMISGDDKPAMTALALVAGAKVDDKTGNLIMNKKEYDTALALANGAKIDKKTGYILGDNTDAFKKLAEANGWKIDPKTGIIFANDEPFKSKVAAVESRRLTDKLLIIDANVNPAQSKIKQLVAWSTDALKSVIKGTAEGVHLYANAKATGGLITGPGTGTSDSIPAWLSNGEYVMTARTVQRLGVGFLNRLNYGHYADGGYVQKAPAYTTNTVTVSDLGMANEIAGLRRDISDMVNIMGNLTVEVEGRDFGRLVRKYA